MLNYIKSEFYRIKQTRSSWILPGVLCLIVLAFNLMLVGFLKADPSFPYTTTKFSLGTLCDSCNVLMLLCVMITSQVFGGEYKNGTMKNVVSYGISKQQIFIGKYIVTVLYSFFVMVLVGATYLISALLLLENSGNAYVVMFLKALFVNTPIYISCVTLMLAFLFNNDNETNAVSGWGIVYVVIPIAMFLIGKKIAVLGTIAAWIPWNVIRDFDMEQRIYAWQTASGAVKYIIMGLGWTVVFFAIGFYKFSKKDIK